MAKTAVVYRSGTGNTQAMAQAVWEGIKAGGEEVDLFTASVCLRAGRFLLCGEK